MSCLRSLCVLLCAALVAACSDGSGPALVVTVTSLNPNNGPLAGGTTVTITGTNFPATVDSVRVGTGRLGSLVRVSATQLTGKTPAGSTPGAVNVTSYTTTAGSGTCASCFTYNPPVRVTGVSPDNGPWGGGTAVTITGVNIPSTVDSVRIGTGRLDSLVWLNSTLLTGIAPGASTPGAVDVTVYTASAGSGTCVGCFSYYNLAPSGVSPPEGPAGGWTPVTISGVFPFHVDSVRVGNGRLMWLNAVSATRLWGITPAGSTAGRVDVTVYTGNGSGTCAGCYTYTSIQFSRYRVTFLGTGFDSSRAVDVNDSGVVVGKVWSAASGWRGRLWTSAGAATDLGVLLPITLNNAGSVVVSLADTLALWENGAVRALGGFGTLGPGPRAVATDINDAREVAVWTTGFGAYLWRNDSLISLGSGILRLGRMNSRGEVAATVSNLYPFAVVLSEGGPRGLGGWGRWSSAAALNDAGWVVGTSEYVMGLQGGGFLFGHGPLPFSPTAINNAQQIVGEGSISQGFDTASLTSLVLDPGWTVSVASAINERGQITAYGYNSTTGARGAIRLDPVATTLSSAAVRRR